MADAPQKLPIPVPLIVLDGVGALLFALGAAERYGNVRLLSDLIAVPQIDIVAIAGGAAIMAIAMVGILRAALSANRSRR